MLKLHELAGDPGNRQRNKRLGRGDGSGRGCTAGKGHKGKKARSGSPKGAAFEGGQMPLIRRIPKFGFSNARFRTPRAELTLGQLDRFDEGATVDLKALRERGLVSHQVERVKVIATGKLTKKLTVKVHGCSAKAREAIEAAGGTCEAVAS